MYISNINDTAKAEGQECYRGRALGKAPCKISSLQFKTAKPSGADLLDVQYVIRGCDLQIVAAQHGLTAQLCESYATMG